MSKKIIGIAKTKQRLTKLWKNILIITSVVVLAISCVVPVLVLELNRETARFIFFNTTIESIKNKKVVKVATITINRPDRQNISAQMIDEHGQKISDVILTFRKISSAPDPDTFELDFVCSVVMSGFVKIQILDDENIIGTSGLIKIDVSKSRAQFAVIENTINAYTTTKILSFSLFGVDNISDITCEFESTDSDFFKTEWVQENNQHFIQIKTKLITENAKTINLKVRVNMAGEGQIGYIDHSLVVNNLPFPIDQPTSSFTIQAKEIKENFCSITVPTTTPALTNIRAEVVPAAGTTIGEYKLTGSYADSKYTVAIQVPHYLADQTDSLQITFFGKYDWNGTPVEMTIGTTITFSVLVTHIPIPSVAFKLVEGSLTSNTTQAFFDLTIIDIPDPENISFVLSGTDPKNIRTLYKFNEGKHQIMAQTVPTIAAISFDGIITATYKGKEVGKLSQRINIIPMRFGFAQPAETTTVESEGKVVDFCSVVMTTDGAKALTNITVKTFDTDTKEEVSTYSIVETSFVGVVHKFSLTAPKTVVDLSDKLFMNVYADYIDFDGNTKNLEILKSSDFTINTNRYLVPVVTIENFIPKIFEGSQSNLTKVADLKLVDIINPETSITATLTGLSHEYFKLEIIENLDTLWTLHANTTLIPDTLIEFSGTLTIFYNGIEMVSDTRPWAIVPAKPEDFTIVSPTDDFHKIYSDQTIGNFCSIEPKNNYLTINSYVAKPCDWYKGSHFAWPGIFLTSQPKVGKKVSFSLTVAYDPYYDDDDKPFFWGGTLWTEIDIFAYFKDINGGPDKELYVGRSTLTKICPLERP